LIVVAVVISALSGGAARAPAAQPGINVASVDPASFTTAATTGARWARGFMLWSDLEPARGVFDERALGVYRQTARASSASGVHVVWVVLGSPAWASATGQVGGPPAHPAEFGAFLSRVAAAMAGTVGAYEIWNEPDDEVFWHAAPNVARYARVLRAAYGAIKSADARARVLFGGLTGNDYAFLRGAYAAGAGPYFDAVAVHTDIPCELRDPRYYVRDAGERVSRWSFLGYRSVRAEMLAHNDARPIWMTELGWSASQDLCGTGVWAGMKAYGVPESVQAEFLTRAYACLARDRYVPVALWFNLADSPVDEAAGVRYGLVRSDGSRRPAWTAFARVAALDGGMHEGCRTHYVGPRVRVRVLRGQQAGTAVAVTHVRGDLRLARFVVRLDGRVIYRRAHTPSNLEVPLGKPARGVRHVVRVTALDVAHNAGAAGRAFTLR
jgi:hypothetical protein